MMTNLQRGMQRELAAFSEAISSDGGSFPEVSKAAFCKARKKLKPEVFVFLSKIILDNYYSSKDVSLWHGHRLIGVDGSTVELPNSEEIQAKYGVFKYREDGKATCMGRTLMLYDTKNHMTLYSALEKMEVWEIEMFWKSLGEHTFGPNDMFIFDRYYASYLLFFFLHKLGSQYCFRMKQSGWKEAESFYASRENSRFWIYSVGSDRYT